MVALRHLCKLDRLRHAHDSTFSSAARAEFSASAAAMTLAAADISASIAPGHLTF